eukprot:m.54005 g.54005  ORF g.54005 m.54005 type:complete len:258 (-) comp21849_c1_seq1:114-887(-)
MANKYVYFPVGNFVHLHVTQTAKPGCRQEFIEHTKSIMRGSLLEIGVQEYVLLADSANLDRHQLVEVYTNMASWKAHRDTQHMATWRDAVKDLKLGFGSKAGFKLVLTDSQKKETGFSLLGTKNTSTDDAEETFSAMRRISEFTSVPKVSSYRVVEFEIMLEDTNEDSSAQIIAEAVEFKSVLQAIPSVESVYVFDGGSAPNGEQFWGPQQFKLMVTFASDDARQKQRSVLDSFKSKLMAQCESVVETVWQPIQDSL